MSMRNQRYFEHYVGASSWNEEFEELLSEARLDLSVQGEEIQNAILHRINDYLKASSNRGHILSETTRAFNAICLFCKDLLEERIAGREQVVPDLASFLGRLESKDIKTRKRALQQLQKKLHEFTDFAAQLQVWIDKRMIEDEM